MTELQRKPRTRTTAGRVRALDTGDQPAAQSTVPAKVKELAVTTYTNNQKANEHKRKHDKARKELTGVLADRKAAGDDFEFNFGTTIEGKRVNLEVGMTEGETTSVDIAKLRQLVGEENFMKIVSATMGAIKEVAGQTVVDQVVSKKGNGVFTSNVKVAK